MYTHRLVPLLIIAVIVSGLMSLDANNTRPQASGESDDTTAVDTIPVDTIPVDTIPVDTIPVDTIPVDTIPVDTIPVDTIPVDTIPPTTDVKYKGDINGDGKVDVADINRLVNIVLYGDAIDYDMAICDVNSDGKVDVADINSVVVYAINNVLVPIEPEPEPLPYWWVETPPGSVVMGKAISSSRDCYDYAYGRLLVWDVNPGDSLRLIIDHHINIAAYMRSWVFYPSSDAATWTRDSALLYGENIYNIYGRDTVEVVVPDDAAVMVCSGFWYPNGRIGDGATAALNPFTAYRLEQWADTTGLVPRPKMRVLAVGNSFTADELSYVPYVIQSLNPDLDVHMTLLTRSSGSIADWTNADATAVDGLQNTYYDWQPFPGRWTTPEVTTLREQVAADDWDVITFQQVSTSPYWNTVKAPLETLVTWLRDSIGYQGKIGWVLTHAYSDSSVAKSEAFPELNTSDEMWNLNQAVADSVMHTGLVDLLIPSGTAVQNARRTRLDHFTLNHLCAVGDIHLQEGIGPFVAACAATGVLLDTSPIGANVELSSTWVIPNASPSYYNSLGTNPTLPMIEEYLGGLGMDPESQALGTWCAEQAIIKPFELIENQNIPEEPEEPEEPVDPDD